MKVSAQTGVAIGPRNNASQVFTPTTLTPAAWYDPSDLSTVFQDTAGTTPAIAGQPVGRLNDKSGNGRHLLQATAANRPILTEAGGLFYLQFDKLSDSMAALFSIPQPWERVSGIYMGDWTANRRIFDGGSTVAGTLLQTGVSPAFAMFDGSAITASNNGLAVVTKGVITERHNGASSRLAVNNGAYTTGNPGTTDPGGITLAAEQGGAGEFGFLRFYGAVMVGRTLTDAEITNLRTYMAGKAGVTL